jgi:CHASE3 domain sensor protein
MALDLKRLAGEVSVRHGIRLDPDDPMMAVVTLNRLCLEDTVQTLTAELTEKLTEATEGLEQAGKRVQARAGSALAEEVRRAAAAIREELHSDVQGATLQARQLVDEVNRAHGRVVVRRWIAAGVCAGLALFGFGVAIGKFLL